jgi:hypothetical protein
MLIVACLEMTSGDRGVSLDTTSVLRSCDAKRQGEVSCCLDHFAIMPSKA